MESKRKRRWRGPRCHHCNGPTRRTSVYIERLQVKVGYVCATCSFCKKCKSRIKVVSVAGRAPVHVCACAVENTFGVYAAKGATVPDKKPKRKRSARTTKVIRDSTARLRQRIATQPTIIKVEKPKRKRRRRRDAAPPKFSGPGWLRDYEKSLDNLLVKFHADQKRKKEKEKQDAAKRERQAAREARRGGLAQ